MNKQKLVELFKDPSGIDPKLLEEVEEMVQENPYFQSAYALIAAGKKKTQASGMGKDLIRAAIYATNRVNLKKYLEGTAGGQQATTPKDAELKETKEADTPTAQPKTEKEETKVRYKERFVEDNRESRKIRRRSEVEKSPVSKEVEKPEAPAKAEKSETRVPADLDIDKLLDSLKSEYKQLETNIKSFDEAEKSLTKAEIEEENEKKKPKSATKSPTKAPATASVKKAAPVKAKSATKTSSTTKKTATTSKTATAKKTTTASKTATAKKATSTKTTATAKKSAAVAKKTTTTTAKKTTPAAKKAAPKSTASKSTAKATASRKINIESMSDDDLLAGDDTTGSKKKEQTKLIDNFIKSEPKISAKKASAKEVANQEDLAKKNQVLTDDIVTENLATIMVKQGRIEKAVEIYNKLIWKFPHKKAYFAGRIKELKEQ